MGNIGDSISDSAPAVGTAGPGYATTINSILTEVITRLTARIPLSSLLVNSNLDMNSQAMLNLGYATISNDSSTPGSSPVNRLTAYQGNIWWVGPSGAVQLTDGASLNAAGVGGITGDYSGAGPMQFRYTTADTRYDAYADFTTGTWAYIRALGFDIAGGATSASYLRHTYTGGTANRTVNWPNATPGTSADILTIDTSGNISYQESIDQFNHTRHASKWHMITGAELFGRGFSTVGSGGSLAVTANYPRHNLTTAGDDRFVQVHLDNEGTTSPDIPIKIQSVFWKGNINGGGHPTIELYRGQNVLSPTSYFTTDDLIGSSQTLDAAVNANGVLDTVTRNVTTSFELTGDQVLFVRVVAATNNLDTYQIGIEYDKQV